MGSRSCSSLIVRSFVLSGGFFVLLIAVLFPYLFPRIYVQDACALDDLDHGVRTLRGLPWKCGWQELRGRSSSSKTNGKEENSNSSLRVFVFLQPLGSWCWNNAGLVLDANYSLLVDTLTDPVLTKSMLASAPRPPDGESFPTKVVYTHPDVDHFSGDQELGRHTPRLGRAETKAAILQSVSLKARLAPLVGMSLGHYVWEAVGTKLWSGLKTVSSSTWGSAWGSFVFRSFFGWSRVLWLLGQFSFHEIDPARVVGVTEEISGEGSPTPISLWSIVPERTSSSSPSTPSEAPAILFRHFGALHSASDSVVAVVPRRIVFMGDLLFVGITPVMWAGPAQNWARALEEILAWTFQLDPTDDWLFVPGHGPVTDRQGVLDSIAYFRWLDRSVTTECRRSGATLPATAAAAGAGGVAVEGGEEVAPAGGEVDLVEEGDCLPRILALVRRGDRRSGESPPKELAPFTLEKERVLISARFELRTRRNGGKPEQGGKVKPIDKIKSLMQWQVEDLKTDSE